MRRLIVLLGTSYLLASAGWAQDADILVQRGEEQFGETCSSGYCHGARGVGGGAPRLAQRGFTQTYINNTVRNGVPGTGMPAFQGSLDAAGLNAVIAYVASLNGVESVAGSGAPAASRPALSPNAQRGEALFSDAVRGFGRCSTCHLVGRFGIPVATPIYDVPANATALKSLMTPNVKTVTVRGDTMSALVVAQKADEVQFYDLSSAAPVLRTEAPANVRITDGSTWRHASVIGAYSDTELATILLFLNEVAGE